MNRTDKKKDRARRTQNLRHRYFEQIAKVLDPVELGEGFRNLSEYAKSWLSTFCGSLPELTIHGSDVEAERIRKSFSDTTVAAVVTVNGVNIPWVDAYRFLYPLMAIFRKIKISRSRAQQDNRYTYEARRQSGIYADQIIRDTVTIFRGALTQAVAQISSCDLRLFWLKIDHPVTTKWRRSGHKASIGAAAPQKSMARIDGIDRWVYRVGGGYEESFQWLAWSSTSLGKSHPEEAYPVYIQKHAMERLTQRLKSLDNAIIQYSLFQSVKNPAFTAGSQEGTFLVDFRLGRGARVGYLVARRLPDMVVITTFLFLTMQGTPEAEHLERLLGLQGPDIEYNGLDDISGFFNSDLVHDKDLAEIFRQAGCQDLMNLSCKCCTSGVGEAARLRQYLGLKRSCGG